MTLLDSNIIIYSALTEYAFLLEFIQDRSPYVSDISRIEVLGFHGLASNAISFFESFFASTTLIPISNEIIAEAIRLRQKRKMSLGDSVIAATALLNDFELITNNSKDFRWIKSLRLIDPFDN